MKSEKAEASCKRTCLLVMLGAAALGVLGGALRAGELRYGFDQQRLPVSGSAWWPSLAALLGVELALYLVFRLFIAKKQLLAGAAFAKPNLPARISIALIAVLGAAGAMVLLFASLGSLSVWVIINIVLMLTAFLMLPIAFKRLPSGGPSGEAASAVALMPVFWCGFRMMEFYRDVQAYPSLSLFLPDLAAYVALVFLFFELGGCACGKSSPARVLAAAALSLSMGLQSAIGYIAAAFTVTIRDGETTLFAQKVGNPYDIFVWLLGAAVALTAAGLIFRPSVKKDENVSAGE